MCGTDAPPALNGFAAPALSLAGAAKCRLVVRLCTGTQTISKKQRLNLACTEYRGFQNLLVLFQERGIRAEGLFYSGKSSRNMVSSISDLPRSLP